MHIFESDFEDRNIQFDQRPISDFCFYIIWNCQHQSDILMPIGSIQIHSLEMYKDTLAYCDMMATQVKCPICKQKLIEHSELQDKVCRMITIKQFANNSPGFDVQFRPFFE